MKQTHQHFAQFQNIINKKNSIHFSVNLLCSTKFPHVIKNAVVAECSLILFNIGHT